VLPQAPRAHGPPSETDTKPRRGPTGARRENEVHTMATIRNLRNKIERMSALNGWRMRWHMQ
jgi:ribosomal protein L19E